MTGVTVTGVAAAQKELADVGKRAADLRPVMRVAVEDLKSFTSDRFDGEVDPEGKKWKDLSPEYAAARRTGSGSGPDIKILTDTARMRNSFSGAAFVDGMEFGFSVDYAEDHHRGRGVTQRRLLPMTDDLSDTTTEGPGGRYWADTREMVDRYIHTGRVV